MSEEKQELTPEQKLNNYLARAVRSYQLAVRWYSHARHYRNAFDSIEPYKMEDVEADLAEDAKKAYREAAYNIMYWRKEVDSTRERLMGLASKKEKTSGKRKRKST